MANSQSTNSQKTLKRIMAYSFGAGVVSGGISLLGEYLRRGSSFWDSMNVTFGVIAGACVVVLALTFIAFLISLVVSSSKGE